jgi:hypothetical protein
LKSSNSLVSDKKTVKFVDQPDLAVQASESLEPHFGLQEHQADDLEDPMMFLAELEAELKALDDRVSLEGSG